MNGLRDSTCWVYFVRFIYRNRCYLQLNRTTKFPVHRIWMMGHLVRRDFTALSRKINPRRCYMKNVFNYCSGKCWGVPTKRKRVLSHSTVWLEVHVLVKAMQIRSTASQQHTGDLRLRCQSLWDSANWMKWIFRWSSANVIQFHVSNRSLQIKRYPLIWEVHVCLLFLLCGHYVLYYF